MIHARAQISKTHLRCCASGRENAYKRGLLNHEDCCYPSAKGQQLIADLLLKTGLSHFGSAEAVAAVA